MTVLSMDVLTLALLVVTFGSLALLIAMIGLRIIRKLHEQHLARLDVRVRPLVLMVAVSEQDELTSSIEPILKLRVFAQQQAEDTAFRMLAEVSGESRRNLAALMVELGAVKKALRRSRSVDPVQRARSAELIGLTNPPQALEILSRLAYDKRHEVRIVAIRGLGRINSVDALETIQSILADPILSPPWITGSAYLEFDATNSFELALFLQNPSPVVRQTAITLASLAPQKETAEHTISALLNDEDRLVRITAARALARLQSRVAIDPLNTAAMTDKNRSVRVAAARALSQLPEAWTRDSLVYLQSSTVEPAVRRAALPAPQFRATEGV